MLRRDKRTLIAVWRNLFLSIFGAATFSRNQDP
jgi:hypothetical protein